jgi:hypothetical protein
MKNARNPILDFSRFVFLARQVLDPMPQFTVSPFLPESLTEEASVAVARGVVVAGAARYEVDPAAAPVCEFFAGTEVFRATFEVEVVVGLVSGTAHVVHVARTVEGVGCGAKARAHKYFLNE